MNVNKTSKAIAVNFVNERVDNLIKQISIKFRLFNKNNYIEM